MARVFLVLGYAGLIISYVFFPSVFAQRIRDGFLLWFNRVMPVLFVASLLAETALRTGLARYIAFRIGAPFRALGLDGAAFFSWLISIIGGFPLGLMTLSSTGKKYSVGQVVPCSSAGLFFTVFTVCGEFLGLNVYYGLLTWFCQAWSGLILAAALNRPVSNGEPFCFRQVEPVAVADALRSWIVNTPVRLLGVGATIALFSTVRIGGGNALYGILELTSGIAALPDGITSLPVAAALLGFSGLCVAVQSLPFLSSMDVGFSRFLSIKAVQGILSGILCTAVIYYSVPVIVCIAIAPWIIYLLRAVHVRHAGPQGNRLRSFHSRQ